MSSTAQQEAEALLKDIDQLPIPPTSSVSVTSQGDALQAIEFLDQITRVDPPKSKLVSTPPTRPASRATERVSLPTLRAKSADSNASSLQTPEPSKPESTGGWSWGSSVWSGASAALQQAKSVVDEGVKSIPSVHRPQQPRHWREGLFEYVKSGHLEKLGQDIKTASLSTLSDLLSVVAPPIAEHEVIHVWLSHDLEGYDGVETLVYRALARILEQVEGGDLVVNRGNESRPKSESTRRELNAADNLDIAIKLAEANIAELVQTHMSSPQVVKSHLSSENPTVHSTVYLRIQPFIAPVPSGLSIAANPKGPSKSESQVQFHLSIRDISHSLQVRTITQPIPIKWLDLWDEHDWVEDQLAETLRLGVEIVGQEYLVARMGWEPTNKPDKDEDAYERVDQQERLVDL
ncbi:maintenance of telomere capping protein 1 [Cantharellus anzutake]|uniref:maintenance of telomere capping protein 1 n=1 Tax=Cantharellus anzutake TaxID=1750568 RepID=UPI0019076035|nr:maintenance of telomere capping protein 1 [Cantharellus anzutake]KAF8343926.1 maintenance of telomere capping protein 1 [Cantharellus anzutake]